MIEPIIAQFNQIYPLSEACNERLREKLLLKEYPRKHQLLEADKTASHVYVMLQGLARSWYVKDGIDITSRFMPEGFIITSFMSFYSRKPGAEFIDLLEDSIVAEIHYNDVQKIYRDFIEFNFVGRILTEKYFALSEQRTVNLRKTSAEEKFQFFLDTHPTLVNRVPSKHIASYLGLSAETLSRLKEKMFRGTQE
ncbi:MAG: Crp/Fnr family transcriptional regulator [Dinghuibacter sp.]|nr:Crp/Fnr family transcriptional regulator [Dinghuibacter sp.]